MSERTSDRWVSAVLSALLHGGVIGLLGFGWWSFHKPSRPVPMLAIDATVVDSRTLEAARSEPTPAPPQPPVQPPPPPQPPPKDDQAERAAAEQREAEQKRAAEEKQRAQEQAEAEQKAREEAQRKAQAEAERQAQEQKKAKEAEETKRQAEERRKAAEAKATAEREAELQRSLAEEEHVAAVRASGAMASWLQQIQARIHHAWLQPPMVRPDLDCTLYVTQVPGGQVVDVKLGACNADAAVRESIQNAAYGASPLPQPPDPALFDRHLTLHFTLNQ
jgi:colicin import membrane protein